MKTIHLTIEDYHSLLALLGYSTAAAKRDYDSIPKPWLEVIDWILIQGHAENQPYWHDKGALRVKKEAELANEA